MSKPEGKLVRLSLSCGDINRDYSHLKDDHEIGTVLRIKHVCPDVRFPIQCVDSAGQEDWYLPEQLRYLNNKEVTL